MTGPETQPPVLILSSWVAAGHVGLSAGGAALQALGRAASLLPTVMLSNHPGFPAARGKPVPPDTLEGFCDAWAENGWLTEHTTLLIGYLPTPAHVAFAAALVARLPDLRVVLDPILGDDPTGLYVPEPVAAAIRDQLLPLAHLMTPNRFELGWLTGAPAATAGEVRQAAQGLRDTNGATLLVTSPPFGEAETGLIEIGPVTRHYRSPMLANVPHGVGDVFAALIAAGLLPGAALGHVAALARTSRGAPHLKIAETAPDWTAALPLTPMED